MRDAIQFKKMEEKKIKLCSRTEKKKKETKKKKKKRKRLSTPFKTNGFSDSNMDIEVKFSACL